MVRLFIEWLHYTRSQKRLSLKLKEFQLSHQRNDLGLLEKHMKIWMMKSASSTLAENLVSLDCLHTASEILLDQNMAEVSTMSKSVGQFIEQNYLQGHDSH